MLLQRALQCFLYKMLHFKIIQGEEQFHRMMENPLDEALKTQMLWNWRHGCTEGFDLLGVSRECEKLPTWSSCRPGSLKKQYIFFSASATISNHSRSGAVVSSMNYIDLLSSAAFNFRFCDAIHEFHVQGHPTLKERGGRNQKWLLTIPTARSMPPLNSSKGILKERVAYFDSI